MLVSNLRSFFLCFGWPLACQGSFKRCIRICNKVTSDAILFSVSGNGKAGFAFAPQREGWVGFRVFPTPILEKENAYENKY